MQITQSYYPSSPIKIKSSSGLLFFLQFSDIFNPIFPPSVFSSHQVTPWMAIDWVACKKFDSWFTLSLSPGADYLLHFCFIFLWLISRNNLILQIVLGDCSYSGMAIRKADVLALFDVDGTLTAPRKVLLLFTRINF